MVKAYIGPSYVRRLSHSDHVPLLEKEVIVAEHFLTLSVLIEWFSRKSSVEKI